jgi:alkanesulfonate monooxygenase SsuD/methylene tetrahydromethanopterin reductase-like flavin-dependent oxidoreductase (luciferase family)
VGRDRGHRLGEGDHGPCHERCVQVADAAQDIEAAAVAGTPDDCVRALREVAEAGAGLVLFTPLFDQAEQTEVLADSVVPRLG